MDEIQEEKKMMQNEMKTENLEVGRVVDSIDRPTVIIGLGGLGCNALGQLKAQVEKGLIKRITL